MPDVTTEFYVFRSKHGSASDGGGQRAGRRVHGPVGPEDHQLADLRAVRAGLDGCVYGHRRDGRVRGPPADGPVHRAAGPAVGRVHCRGDGAAVPRRRARHDIVLGVGRHTIRARDGHVPRLAAGVRAVLRGPVRRLRAHMVHARVARVAARQGPARSRGTGRAPVDGDRCGRGQAEQRGHRAAAVRGPQAVRASVLRAAVVPRTAGRAVRVLLRAAVLGRERRRVLLGDVAEARQPRPQRVPLHDGSGRDPTGRLRAGVRPDQEVRPPAAGRLLGRGHVRVPAVPGRFGQRHRHRPRRSRHRRHSRGTGTHGRRPGAGAVHRGVHGVRQHRSGAVAVDHVGRGEKRSCSRHT